MSPPSAAAKPAHVVIIGGGPAGLTAAAQLRRSGISRVTVLDREQHMGGIPRHTDHVGFGMRDLHRLMTGPAYARRLASRAQHHGVELRSATTAIGIDGTTVILATGDRLEADAVVLATGVRERPRAARLVPGDRPSGVFTTGSIQQLTAIHRRTIGHRGVIVGAEHVSFSAIWTLRHGGCQPVAMVTELARHQTLTPLRLVTATRHRVPIITGAWVAEIIGRGRVEAVVLSSGRRIDCDTVVFTGDWIPDHEIVRRAGLSMTPRAASPAVTQSYQTSSRGVFAIGNLVHPAETADICALDGLLAAAAVVRWLTNGQWPSRLDPIDVTAPVLWASHSSHGVTARVGEVVHGRLQLLADEQVVATTRRRQLVPHRAILLRANVSPTARLMVRLAE
jgi:thioredoxin reductase